MDPDIIVRKFSENTYVTDVYDLDTVVLESKNTADFVSILATNFKQSMNTNVQWTTYNLNPTDTAIVAGKVLWDASSGMLAIGRDDGLSVMRFNEGVQTPVKFTEPVSIGTPVYLISQDGDFPTVGKALGSDIAKSKVIGFASENCAINTVGHMCSVGTIRNVASSVFATGQVLSAGDKLYLSTDGKLANSRPSSGENRYVVAVVLSTSNNTILCNATYNADALDLLDDRIDNILEGQDLDPNKDVEVLDARYSPVTDTTYDNIGDRMEEGEARLDTIEGEIEEGVSLTETGIGIVSLPSNAQGNANPTVEGRTATNLVENGDFSDGLNQWVYILTNTPVISDGIAKFTATSQYGRLYYPSVFNLGYVYFCVAKVKANSDLVQIGRAAGTWSGEISRHSGSGEFELLMSVYNPVSDNDSIAIKDLRASDWDEIQVDYVYVIDLTSIYGSGNEPSVSDCAKIFSYFDGTKSISMPARVRSVGRNLFDYKYPDVAGRFINIFGKGLYYFGVDYYELEHNGSIGWDIILKPNTTYTISAVTENCSRLDFQIKNSLGSVVSSKQALSLPNISYTFTTTDDISYRFGFGAQGSPAKISEIQLELGSTATPYEPYQDSTLYIADDKEVRSVPAVKDQVKVVNGELVKVGNVGVGALESNDYASGSALLDNWVATGVTKADELIEGNQCVTFVALDGASDRGEYLVSNLVVGKLYRARFTAKQLVGSYGSISSWTIGASISTTLSDSFKTYIFYFIASTQSGWARFYAASSSGLGSSGDKIAIYDFSIKEIATTDGTPKAISSQSQVSDDGTNGYYQLATPIVTPLTTSGTLKAFQNGSVYYEPYYEGSHQTDASSQITLPYEGTIDTVYGYDENLVEYELLSSEYSLTGTTLTITGALENEVFYVEMQRTEPLAPEMEIEFDSNIAGAVEGAYDNIKLLGNQTEEMNRKLEALLKRVAELENV